MYAISKKQKQERIAQALELRRTRLIKTGVTRWIKVAFHLSSERSRYSQVRHIEQARSVHQFVYKCAMHWRTWTKKRVSQRPQQQPRVLKQIDRSESRHQPVELPSRTSRRALTGDLPDLFKTRPKPRVPDYLRDSFDVSTIDKEPISSMTYNLVATNGVRRYMGEEELPRPGPPPPCPRLAIHPHQRSPGQDSLMFLPSSEGEGETSIVHNEKTRRLRPEVSARPLANPVIIQTNSPKEHKTIHKDAPVLLPPSSFESRSKTTRPDKQTVDRQDMITNTGNNDNGLHYSKEPTYHNSPNSSKGSFSPQSSVHSYDQSDTSSTDSEEHQTSPPVLRNHDLQTQIFDAKKKLQEHYELKLQYRTVKRRRDELEKAIRNQQENTFVNSDTQELLTQLAEEADDLFTKIERNRPLVEDLAININKMIEKIG